MKNLNLSSKPGEDKSLKPSLHYLFLVEAMEEWTASLGFLLIITGFAMIFLAAALAAVRGEGRGGGVIMIGPFPIIFGSDAKTMKSLLIFALILLVVFIVLTLIVMPLTFSGWGKPLEGL